MSLSIFALGIMPYVSAAILIQLTMFVSNRLKAQIHGGEYGRLTINQYTRYVAIVLAAFQGYGLAVGLEAVRDIVTEPGWLFRLTVTVTLTGGVMLLVWLSEQITARGIGNGLALILLLGIIVDLPHGIASTLEVGRRGLLSNDFILGLIVVVIALTAFVVFMELAQRRVPVVYRSTQAGGSVIDGRSHLAVKLNSAGAVIPALLASWALLLPVTLATFLAGWDQPWSAAITSQLGHGRPLYMIFYALSVVVCALFYTAFVLDPREVADGLKRYDGVVAGIEPGEATAAHLDRVLSCTAAMGALYLAFILLVPELLIWYAAVPSISAAHHS